MYGIDRSTRIPVFDIPATTLKNNDIPVNRTWLYVCPGLQGGAMFASPAYSPKTGTLYVGMNDHCAWYIKNNGIPFLKGFVVKDWPAAAKLEAPRGWVTAINGANGSVLWQYQAESQVQAGMVPTESGLLFVGDTHGHLLIFDAANGNLLNSIDTGGALNSGLISYSVRGDQYVAATVGGATENPSTVAGALRVVVYGLHGSDHPKVMTLNRQPPPAGLPPGAVAFQTCIQCHGPTGGGTSAPPLGRQSQLADPDLLKEFLATVPAPMPRLYPGVLTDKDVEHRRLFEDHGLQMRQLGRKAELRTARAAVDRRNSGMARGLFGADIPTVSQLPPGGQSQAGRVRVESDDERGLPTGLPAPGRRPSSPLLHGAPRRFL